MHRDDFLKAHPEHQHIYDDLIEITDLACDPAWIAEKRDFVGKALAQALQLSPLYNDTVNAIVEVMAQILRDHTNETLAKRIADVMKEIDYPKSNLFQTQFRDVVLNVSELAGAYGAIRSTTTARLQRLLQAYIDLIEVFGYNHNVTLPSSLFEQMSETAKQAENDGLNDLAAKLYEFCSGYYIHQGEFLYAEHYAKRAMSWYGSIDDLKGCAEAALRLAIISRECHQGKQGDSYLDKVRKYAEDLGSGKYYANMLYEEGVRNYIEDYFQWALTYFDDAMVIFEKLNLPHHIAMTHTMLALTYIYMERFDDAKAEIERARAGWVALNNEYELANMRFVDATLELRGGNTALGLEMIAEARESAKYLPENESRQQLIERIDKFEAKYR